MKYSVAIVAALAAFTNAQSACEASAEAIPACGLGYIASYASASYSCGLVDFQCQCSNSASIQGGVAGAIASACPNGINDVLNAVQGVCSCASANSGSSISLNSVQSACQASAAAINPCALGYIADAAKSIGGCALYDFACQCSNSASIQGAVAGAVASACPGGINDVLSQVSNVCACVSSNGGSGSSPASATSGSGSSGSSAGASAGSSAGSSAKATSAAGGSSPKQTSAPAFSSFTGGAAGPAAAGGFLAALGGLVAML